MALQSRFFGFSAKAKRPANSREIVDEDFAGLPESYKRKITRDNVIKLYNIDFY